MKLPLIGIEAMKLYCPLSGVSYKTTGYGHGQAPHPIFYLPLDNLVEAHLPAFLERKLSDEEVHLLGCALLHKLPTQWVHPVTLSSGVLKRWYSHIEYLAGIACRLDSRSTRELPTYHITRENANIGNLKQYIDSLAYANEKLDFGTLEDTPTYIKEESSSRLLTILRKKLVTREDKREFPSLMADWADMCAGFPKETFTSVSGESTTICEHWKHIIRKCYQTKDYIEFISSDSDVTLGDIDELVEYCEHNIELGSTHSFHLMKKLRDVRSVVEEFRSPAPAATIRMQENAETISILLSDSASAYTVPVKDSNEGSETEKGEANDNETILDKESVPETRPIRSDYSSFGEFLKAKINWNRVHGGE